MMGHQQETDVKNNVGKFDDDVRLNGAYAYTMERLSASIANSRFSDCIASSYYFFGKSVLDLGCGDGTYTLEFPRLGVREVVGVDPAVAAIKSATTKARRLGIDATVKFEVGNIYSLDAYLADDRFDCIVLRGVLHHLPDPARAIAGLAGFNGTLILLEPNGNNPVLKLLERYSRYHIEHEERSFSRAVIHGWLRAAGFCVHSSRVFNLVPMFCPDWMARALRFVGPFLERVPMLREIACGQSIVVAHR